MLEKERLRLRERFSTARLLPSDEERLEVRRAACAAATDKACRRARRRKINSGAVVRGNTSVDWLPRQGSRWIRLWRLLYKYSTYHVSMFGGLRHTRGCLLLSVCPPLTCCSWLNVGRCTMPSAPCTGSAGLLPAGSGCGRVTQGPEGAAGPSSAAAVRPTPPVPPLCCSCSCLVHGDSAVSGTGGGDGAPPEGSPAPGIAARGASGSGAGSGGCWAAAASATAARVAGKAAAAMVCDAGIPADQGSGAVAHFVYTPAMPLFARTADSRT